MTKGEKLTEADAIEWSSTIDNIRTESADVYCREVSNEARSVIKDSECIHHLIKSK